MAAKPQLKLAGPRRPLLLEVVLVLATAGALAAVYEGAPVTQLADAKYTLLVATALLDHGSFALEPYLPAVEPMPIQLEAASGHVVYRYPPASPLLSVPFTWWQAQHGKRPLDDAGHYSFWREEQLQRQLAAWIVAATCVALYALARAWLSAGGSLALMLLAGLGTPLLSTASRALWSHTWGTLIFAGLLLVLQRARRPRPVLLGTLAAWLYATRPTWSLAIVAVGLWLVWLEQRERPEPPRRWLLLLLRRPPLLFAVTVLLWLLPLAAYGWHYWQHPLPSYYRHPMGNPAFLQALAANLLSPARGLLVYCPFLLPGAVLLWRGRQRLPDGALARWSLGYLVVHWLVVSLNPYWWGGGSYGPRFMTDVVPLLVLLLAAGLATWRPPRAPVALALGLTVPLALLLHSNGAWNLETWRWHNRPHPDGPVARMWSWQRAEFLAGLWQPPPTYALGTPLDFADAPTVLPFLLRGWSAPEQHGTWTDGPRATLRWQMLPPGRDTTLELELHPFQPGEVVVAVNGVVLATPNVTGPQTLTVAVPAALGTADVWTVDLQLAAAARPDTLGPSPDTRTLGVQVARLLLRYTR